jgi:adenine deaminase
MRRLQHKLAIARGEIPAELLFKNGRLVNVLSGEIHDANIAVDDGRVIGLGDYKARKTIDLRGAYIAPSLMDGHFHLESSQLTAPEFARAVVPHGTGTVVIDPREYANDLAQLGLPIAGLVSDRPLEEVIGRLRGLNAAARALGCELDAPFMTLSFLSLSPIPELKLTDQGLIDAVRMRKTKLFCQ